MGRSKNKVSVWIMRKKHAEDEPDFLKEEFRIEYYDADELEVVGDPEWKSIPIGQILRELSHSSSFAVLAEKAALDMNIKTARRAIALYNFQYSPSKVKAQLPDDPIFIGAFDWSNKKG